MPREGITLGQVEAAIEDLHAEGLPTSYRRIRAKLGEGSLTTIANHVKEFERQRQLEAFPRDSARPPLPDPVVKALFVGAESTWAQLLEAAEGITQEVKETADGEIATAKAQVEQAIAQRDEIETENTRLTDALGRTKAELSALKKAHDKLQTKHQDLDTQLATAHTKTDGLNKLVAELKRTIGQLTTDVKNADRRTALAQERLEKAEQAHQETVAALRAQFAKERETLDKQRDSEAQRADELQKALTSIKSELAKASTQLAGEREAHHSTKSELKGVVKDLQGRTRERDRQAAQIAKLDERCAASDAALKRAEEQFGELVSDKDERIAEQAATMRGLTAALKRVQTTKRQAD